MTFRRRIVEIEAVRPLEDSALLLEIVRSLVARPAAVSVATSESNEGVLRLRVEVADADRGKVIGRKGRTISAIRNLFSAIGRIDGRRVLIDLRGD